MTPDQIDYKRFKNHIIQLAHQFGWSYDFANAFDSEKHPAELSEPEWWRLFDIFLHCKAKVGAVLLFRDNGGDEWQRELSEATKILT